MKNTLSRKTISVIIMLVFVGAVFVPSISSNESIEINENIQIATQTIDEVTEIIYQIDNFDTETVGIDEIEYVKLLLGDESNILSTGMPDLPNICRSIVIPDNLKMDIQVISYNYVEFENILIAPSKGNLLRSVNPDDVPYEFGETYNQDAWYPENLAELDEPYIIRDFRGQVVKINPLQYNPVSKTLRFYTDVTVEVYPIGSDNVNCIYRDAFPLEVDVDFKKIYDRHFINFNAMGRYDSVSEQGNMLVICYDSFIDQMQPFVEWKIMKGIPTEIVKVSEIGDANDIKTHIENYYTDNGLTFVLLVGDAAQVPPLNIGSSASDPSYTYVAGSDHYPDLFVGRFSAQNTDHVNTQVERSLEYEKDLLGDGEWYHKGSGVASSQGAGQGDEGEADWQHMRILRTLLMDYAYTEIDEFYDGSQGEEDASGNPSSSMVADALNDGRSIINYCGHGSPSSWGSSGFSNSDINNLVNDNMLPFVTCVACNNGQFDDYDACFCETWLRATNNGEPAGAIVSTGSTVSMSWAPPMDAQDEFIDLIIESYEDNIKHTFGGIHYNGVMHMNDEYGSSGYSETDYWTFFGDPSLYIRTDTPVEMSVTRDEEIEEESEEFAVTVPDVEDALCAISRDGELLGYAYTDENNYALIQLKEPIMGEEPITLVITAYNKLPYIADIPVHINDPPEIPQTPDGPTAGQPYTDYTFTTTTTDPNGHQVYYQWSWGDGSTSEWLGPFNSAETVSATNRWNGESATYGIKVKAKDTEGDETEWSEQHWITITKSRVKTNAFILRLIERFSDHFPILEKILLNRSIFN